MFNKNILDNFVCNSTLIAVLRVTASHKEPLNSDDA